MSTWARGLHVVGREKYRDKVIRGIMRDETRYAMITCEYPNETIIGFLSPGAALHELTPADEREELCSNLRSEIENFQAWRRFTLSLVVPKSQFATIICDD